MFKIFIIAALVSASMQGVSQVVIQNGTRWVSYQSTYVVLNNMNLEVNASSSIQNIFKFTGDKDVNVGGNVQPAFYRIEMAKNNGSELILQNSIGITSSLHFAGGVINLNGNNIYLDENAVLQNESETSHISGYPGVVQMKYDLNVPLNSHPGNLGAVFTSTDNLGTILISRGHEPQSINGNSGTISRYFEIQMPANPNPDVRFRFYYLNAELNGLDENNLVLWHSANQTNWLNQGFTSRDPALNFVEKTGVNNFSRFTLSNAGNPLPVTGLHLNGLWQNNATRLNWVTQSEYNNSHFIIERKYANQMQFSQIGMKPTIHPGGNSSSLSQYYFIDAAVLSQNGPVQYRLRQMDNDGQFVFSNTILIQSQSTGEIFILGVHPTIVSGGSVFVRTGNINADRMQLRVFDATGKLVVNRELSYLSQWINMNYLAKGMYYLELKAGQWQYSSKFIRK